jgi:predicted DNA-binding protein (UPF0251 family)
MHQYDPISDHIALIGTEHHRRLKKDPDFDANCVRAVVRGLTRGKDPDQRFLGENLIRIVEETLYELGGFETFAGWVFGAQPSGLQLRDAATARRLRSELLAVELVGAWAEVLPHIVREPGRPKRHVDSDHFNRFWPADTSDTGIDRRIMKLYRDHFEIYRRLVERKVTLSDASAKAGISRQTVDKQLHNLMSAWNKASPEIRDTFLKLATDPTRSPRFAQDTSRDRS